MKRTLTLLALLVGCASDVNHDGRTVIVCQGDSNTFADGVPLYPQDSGWCEQLAGFFALAGRDDVTVLNRGHGGTTAVDYTASFFGPGLFIGACNTVAASVSEDHADYELLAFVTNDIGVAGASPEAIVAKLEQFVRSIRTARIVPLVALGPPRFDRPELMPAIEATNTLLRQAFPPSTVMDFFTGFTRGDFGPDGLHLNAAGHTKRAAVAFRTLTALP